MINETILVCDPSVEGVFTGIYKAYEWKLKPEVTYIQIMEEDLRLFAQYRQVDPEGGLACKVASTLIRKFGREVYEDMCYALAAEAADRGQAVYRTVVAGLSGKVKGKLMEALADPWVRRVFELSRHVHNEEHRMRMFVRFRELEGGVLFAQIEPDADVVGLVMPHFADRFPLENFVIADTRRQIAGVHERGKNWFLLRLEDVDRLRLENMEELYTAEEREMAGLFRQFCTSVGIRQRRNRALQQQFLPLKYRGFMTEFDHLYRPGKEA